jgi:hypothetical protein
VAEGAGRAGWVEPPPQLASAHHAVWLAWEEPGDPLYERGCAQMEPRGTHRLDPGRVVLNPVPGSPAHVERLEHSWAVYGRAP